MGVGGQHAYKGTMILAGYFGGTRNPMAIRWPARIKPDPTRARSSITATTSSQHLRDSRYHTASRG